MARDLAIDLGTANTVVYVRGQGIVLNEPSVVALNSSTGDVLSVGADAKLLIGRTPSHIRAIRPLRDGVVTQLRMTEEMIRYFMHKALGRRTRPKPRVVVCVPTGVTEVEQRAVEEAAKAAGAKAAYLVEEPMAAAIGAGLPVHEPVGLMVVDVGGGTTEVAVISFGGIVASTSLRVGGDALDAAIVQHLKKARSVAIGDRTAEALKVEVGSAFPLADEVKADVKGRDLVTGLPAAAEVTGKEIRLAIEDEVSSIVDAVRDTLDRCPPELAGDIMDRGIVLAGGGALLRGLDERLRHETQMPVLVADDPLSCVAVGAGKCLEQFEGLKEVLLVARKAQG
jgi:rod shape-determining protein MreB and related proteins